MWSVYRIVAKCSSKWQDVSKPNKHRKYTLTLELLSAKPLSAQNFDKLKQPPNK